MILLPLSQNKFSKTENIYRFRYKFIKLIFIIKTILYIKWFRSFADICFNDFRALAKRYCKVAPNRKGLVVCPNTTLLCWKATSLSKFPPFPHKNLKKCRSSSFKLISKNTIFMLASIPIFFSLNRLIIEGIIQVNLVLC